MIITHLPYLQENDPELAQIITDLPDTPEEADPDMENEQAELVIYREHGDRYNFGYLVSIPDAKAYVSQDDTHGDDWFVGWVTR